MSLFTHKIEIGFGIGLTADGKRIPGPDAFTSLRRIGENALQAFGGYTLVETVGAWRDPNGKIFREPGRTLTILVNGKHSRHTAEEAIRLCDFIKAELQQAAVVLTISEVDCNYV